MRICDSVVDIKVSTECQSTVFTGRRNMITTLYVALQHHETYTLAAPCAAGLLALSGLVMLNARSANDAW